MTAFTQPTSSSAQQTLIERVQQAYAERTPLRIVAGDSKQHLGYPVTGEALSVVDYQGIINYEPSELVITVRAGTPLHIVEATLAEQGQMLGFEPPSFSKHATIGGTIACGLSGPRRPYAGAARDFVLGVTMINGRGELLRFGGQVMKNVAGYDVSRLMCGAQGTLGVLLDISLKVIPMPVCEQTLVLAASEQQMQSLLAELGRKPLPLSATLLHNNQLYIRLSGSQGGVKAASQLIGGEQLDHTSEFWRQVREQQHPFFIAAHTAEEPLWRLSLPPTAPAVTTQLAEQQLIEWGGAQRWLYSERNSGELKSWVSSHGGQLQRVCVNNRAKFSRSPLPPALFRLNQRLRQSFDPARILNPGRFYPEL